MINVTGELIVGLGALFLVTKILGPSQIGKLTPFHFVSALVLGELLGNAIYEHEIGLLYVLYALTLWAGMMVLVEQIGMRFPRARSIIQGNPEILIRKGLIQKDALQRTKLNLNELQYLLRKNQAFSVREVEYAILEADGSMSVLKKPVHNTPTRRDLNLPPREAQLPITLIADGLLLTQNLATSEVDADWVRSQLAAQGVTSIRDVFYAEWQEGEGLLIQRYGQKSLPPI